MTARPLIAAPCLPLSLSLAAALLASACCNVLPSLPDLKAPSVRDAGALEAAATRYYTATDVAGLRAAVSEARDAAPGSARYHELAADLARLESRTDLEFAHHHEALLDRGGDAAALHLMAIGGLQLTVPELLRAEVLATTLAEGHPDPAVRAAAAWEWMDALWMRGEVDKVGAVRAAHAPPLPLALIGTWDNDQGKGFDTARPPEDGVDLSARYPGTVVEIGWRAAPPADPRGVYDLASMMTPNGYATAYATAVFETREAGDYELRVGVSGPFKLWVDGQLALQVRDVGSKFAIDQYAVPVTLPSGPHRVLLKTAHEKGGWELDLRLTGAGGRPASGVRVLSPDAAVPERPGLEIVGTSLDALIDARVAGVEPAARRAMHAMSWASELGAWRIAIERAEAYLEEHPGALVARIFLAGEHWNHQERGRAADQLGELDREFGGELSRVRLQQARFWLQQDLRTKAREHMLGVRDAHPESAEAWRRLAGYYRKEGFQEERCQALERADALRPDWLTVRPKLGSCYSASGYRERARRVYEGLNRQLPGYHRPLSKLRTLAEEAGDDVGAVALGERIVAVFPTSFSANYNLGKLLRRVGREDEAAAALRAAAVIDPAAASPWTQLGAMAFAGGDTKGALAAWREALRRNPNDDKTARRVALLEPGPTEPWVADAPSEGDIEQALSEVADLTPGAGADLVYLIDDEVTQLNADGSRSGLVTQVVYVVNERGRDRVLSMPIQHGGTKRVLHGYALLPDGRRTEASAVRERKVRFRALEAGATVVLQYRYDSGPQAYLALHLSSRFFFQIPQASIRHARWALWLAPDETLHEAVVGETVTRSDEVRGGMRRIAWEVRDQAPLLAEPKSPPYSEIAPNVTVSTVPDWGTFVKWERALLQGAFRESPEMLAVVAELIPEGLSVAERVQRIHGFTMQDIRYEQDYENTIAGVKPHAAPVVLERRYGDCKDKAVLFITMARMVGVEARFAILRTTRKGVVQREVPFQQFDHAIVYVPAQTGIAAGRFYDPTADMLDLAAVRSDDVGADALVYDPLSGEHAWVPIPYQAPDANRSRLAAEVTLDADGAGAGALSLTAVGEQGSALRRATRNAAMFGKGMSAIVAALFPGATTSAPEAVEVKSLVAPAVIRVAFEAPALARSEEGRPKLLKARLPWQRFTRASKNYQLPTRKYPLVVGVPSEDSMVMTFTPPKGWKVASVPEDAQVDAPCGHVARRTTVEGSTVTVRMDKVLTCARVQPEQYGAQRDAAQAIDRLIEEAEVVWTR